MRRARLVTLLAAMVMVASSCTVYGWGANQYGELGDAGGSTPAAIASDAIAIAAGGSHTCWISTDRSLWCQGSNSYGKLGQGTSDPVDGPVAVGSSKDWASISAGEVHTCAIRTDASLWCWGNNEEGTLGDGTNVSGLPPAPVAGGGTWRTVSAGITQTCGIQTDGSLWCWGSNEFGEVGDGTTDQANVPVRIGEDLWASVGTSLTRTCGVKADGSLWCWGYHVYGDDQELDGSLVPAQIQSDTDWVQTEGSASFARHCALRTDHSMWCWGWNFRGEIGDGTTTLFVDTPSRVVGPADWRSMSLGTQHTCGIRTDATLWCWGGNRDGQAGLASDDATAEPQRVGTASDWFAITAGSNHTAGITAS